MKRKDMIEILDICMQKVKAGHTIDEAVADFPAEAHELRALLQIALDALPQARETSVPTGAQVKSKTAFLAQAEQMQRQTGAAWLWSLLHFFRTNAGQIAFGLAAVALLFVALSSAGALPGDGLYPIKLAAEQAEVDMASSPAGRVTLEASFDNLRAEEVIRMIQMQRTGKVSFGGFLSKNSQDELYAAGIPLSIGTVLQPQAGNLLDVYVEITGELGMDGKVTVEKIEPRLETLVGIIEQLGAEQWQVGGRAVKITAASRINGTPALGNRVTLQTAQIKDSQQVLVISGEVIENTPTSPKPTATRTPSATPTVTNTRPPEATRTPTVSSESEDPEHTQEPEDDHKSEDDHSDPTEHPEDDGFGSSGDDGGDHSGSGG